MSMGLSIPSYAENYAYDDAGRLISVIYGDGSSIVYTYDAAGNILSIVTGSDSTDPFDNPDSTSILDSGNPAVTIQSSSTSVLYGSNDDNNITIEAGGKVRLINNPGSNTITIEAESSIFTVLRSGATVTFEGTDGTLLKLPATTTSQSIVLNDRPISLIISSGKVMLGGQVVNITATSIY